MEDVRELALLERRIRGRFVKAFATYGLLADGDRVLVGLSGGKDSLCLLEMMAGRARIHHPRFAVEAAHVRMENVDYRTSADFLERFCSALGVPLHIATTGFNPTPPAGAHPKPPCFLCSWQRRKQLFSLAQQLGCNKIALGHHQDDMLVTALMNIFFQSRFETMPPKLQMEKMPLQIIRPLCLVEEADIRRYAELRGYERQERLCPYESGTQRTAMRQLLDKMVSIHPEARHSLWSAIAKCGQAPDERKHGPCSG